MREKNTLSIDIERNAIEYSNLPTNSQHSQKSYTKSKYCTIYTLICLGIFLIFFINFLFTINAFDDNRIVSLKPDVLCKAFINDHNKCLTKHKNKNIGENKTEEILDECSMQSRSVEDCYDGVSQFNRKCFVYISELDKCVRDHLSSANNQEKKSPSEYLLLKCNNFVNDITLCSNDLLQIDFDLLFDGKN
jgi:hypothetical protein